MLDLLTRVHTYLKAHAVKYFRTREVEKVLLTAHAEELRHTPIGQWPQVQAEQRAQIMAVRDGKLDIIDRRSWAFPYLPESLHRLNQPIVKNTPYSLRRFSETPVPRRGINLIKTGVNSLPWKIRKIDGAGGEENDEDVEFRIKAATNSLKHPNNTDSFRSLQDAMIEDYLCFGAAVLEPRITPDPEKPVKMWPVDTSTVRIYANWTESTPDLPRYAQMTALKGERGLVEFLDKELWYIKANARSNTPFGLGAMEVAFHTINSFLGVQEMAGRAGSDQVHKTWLWWEMPQNPAHIETIRRHVQNELEGQAKVSILAGMKKPEVVEITPVTEDDLLLNWQEMLIRMFANAFGLSPLCFGIERDVNRSTGEVLDDKDFNSAVVPLAVQLADAYTRLYLHKLLRWTDLEFVFEGIDDPDLQTQVTICEALYTMNAITPNEVRVKFRLPKATDKFSDCTQFQSILLQQEAMAMQQDKAADKGMARQQTMQTWQQSQQMDQLKQEQALFPQQDGNDTVPATDQGDQPQQAPRKPGIAITPPQKPGAAPMQKAPAKSLQQAPRPRSPKLPMKGAKFSAQDVAKMTPDEVKQHQQLGNLPKDKAKLKQNMQKQEPGILQELSDELKTYFEDMQDEAEKDRVQLDNVPPKALANQKAKFRKAQHAITDLEKVTNPYSLDPAFAKSKMGMPPQKLRQLRRVGIPPLGKVTK